PPRIQQALRDAVGCTRTDADGRYRFDETDTPGLLFIPRGEKEKPVVLETNRRETLRLRSFAPVVETLQDEIFGANLTGAVAALTRGHAHDRRDRYLMWVQHCFAQDLRGRDLDAAAEAIYTQLRDGTFALPVIQLVA